MNTGERFIGGVILSFLTSMAAAFVAQTLYGRKGDAAIIGAVAGMVLWYLHLVAVDREVCRQWDIDRELDGIIRRDQP